MWAKERLGQFNLIISMNYGNSMAVRQGPGSEATFPIGAGGPNLVAVEQPADDHFGGLGADRGEIGAGVRLQHADAKNASPRVMADTMRRIMSSVPDFKVYGPLCRSAIQWAETGAPAANIASNIT